MRCIPHLNFLFLIASLASSVAAIAGEPPSEPILRIETGEHSAPIKRIATDNAGRYLVTVSDDKTARVWSLTNGHLLSTLRIPIGTGNEGKLNAVALSPDGNTVAVGGWTQLGGNDVSILLFDRASGRLLRRLTDFPDVINHLAFSHDGKTLAVTVGNNKGLRLFSVADWRLVAEDNNYDGDSYYVDFSKDIRLVTTSYDHKVRIYQWDGTKLSLNYKIDFPHEAKPYAARFSPDGNSIAVGLINASNVVVLNTLNPSSIYELDTNGVNGGIGRSLAWTTQGLAAAGDAQKKFNNEVNYFYIRQWIGQKIIDSPVGESSVTSLISLDDGHLVYSTGSPSWGKLDSLGNLMSQHKRAQADFRDYQDGFALSVDGGKIRFSYENKGRDPIVFDSVRRQFIQADVAGLTSPIISSEKLTSSDWKYTRTPKLNGKPLRTIDNDVSRSIALLPNDAGVVLGSSFYLYLYDSNGQMLWFQDAPGEVWAVNVSQDGRWVVAAYADGTIRWYRVSDGVEQLAFFPHADKKRWVMWTPSGYYDASPGAEDLIGWHVNNGKDQAADFFPASRFRERFYRPDVLSNVLETQDEAEAVRLANNESGRRTQTVTAIAQVLPPVVEIVSPAGDSTVQSGTIKVRYRVRTAADAPVTAMRVRVNGLLQSDTRALKRVADNDDDVKEIEVTIPEAGIQSATRALKRAGQGKTSAGDAASSSQEIEVQLFAENKFSTSTPAILRLQLAGGKGTTKQTTSGKPKLYVLAVGVSKYANPEFNLGLASKDANDFVKSLKGQKGKLYSDVVVKLLTDDKATKDDVLDGLDWLKQNVTANDVGVMFVAGHGMNDKLGGYYFMPHNADPDKLARTGVSQSEIKQTFANLPGHTVFFIDTCYSGGVMGNVRTSGFVNDLASAENGAVVFTASSAGQLSQENPSWGNGAFTKSVVEGLNGKADAFNSGAVTVKGLDFYVDGRVKSLTNGQQTPVSIAPGGLSDFPLAGVGK